MCGEAQAQPDILADLLKMKTSLKILILITICLGDYAPSQLKCRTKRIIMQHKEDDYIKIILLILQKCRNTSNVNLDNARLKKDFHYSKKTKIVNLSENDIEEIQEDTFKELYKVEQLDLSSNKITSVNSLMFSDLNQLNVLNLSMNSLENIFNFVLPKSVGLLDLSWNSLDNSQKNVFNSLTPFEVRKIREKLENSTSGAGVGGRINRDFSTHTKKTLPSCNLGHLE